MRCFRWIRWIQLEKSFVQRPSWRLAVIPARFLHSLLCLRIHDVMPCALLALCSPTNSASSSSVSSFGAPSKEGLLSVAAFCLLVGVLGGGFIAQAQRQCHSSQMLWPWKRSVWSPLCHITTRTGPRCVRREWRAAEQLEERHPCQAEGGQEHQQQAPRTNSQRFPAGQNSRARGVEGAFASEEDDACPTRRKSEVAMTLEAGREEADLARLELKRAEVEEHRAHWNSTSTLWPTSNRNTDWRLGRTTSYD